MLLSLLLLLLWWLLQTTNYKVAFIWPGSFDESFVDTHFVRSTQHSVAKVMDKCRSEKWTKTIRVLARHINDTTTCELAHWMIYISRLCRMSERRPFNSRKIHKNAKHFGLHRSAFTCFAFGTCDMCSKRLLTCNKFYIRQCTSYVTVPTCWIPSSDVLFARRQ